MNKDEEILDILDTLDTPAPGHVADANDKPLSDKNIRRVARRFARDSAFVFLL